MLRVKESMPFTQNWGTGYGSELPGDLLKKYLKIGDNKILIGSPADLGLKGDDIFEDAGLFFKSLSLSDNITVLRRKNERRNAQRHKHG